MYSSDISSVEVNAISDKINISSSTLKTFLAISNFGYKTKKKNNNDSIFLGNPNNKNTLYISKNSITLIEDECIDKKKYFGNLSRFWIY